MVILRSTVVRHWLPIITFCPVNGMPDVIYISVEFDTFVELYQARKKIRKATMWKKMFMEDIGEAVRKLFPESLTITVRLAFDRHVVKIYPRAR